MFRTIEIEQPIITELWGGTRDWVVEIHREGVEGIYTVDHKTSAALYPEYRWQVATYSSYDGTIPALLRLDKETGEYEWKHEGMRGWSKKNTETYRKKFNAYLNLWWALREA